MRGPQCRITGKYQRCGNEAVDPIGQILLCQTHLELAIELLRSRGIRVELDSDDLGLAGGK